MPISVVRLGTPRKANEGLRIGTVRRPPRGVPKSEFAKRDYYDVWLPTLSPTPDLVKQALASQHENSPAAEKEWAAFVRKFRAEMNQHDASHLLDLLAALSHTSDFAIGCYCEEENRCHRSVLRELLTERGASFVKDRKP